MQQQDIERIMAEADQAIANAKVIAMGQSRADISSAKSTINDALNGVEALTTFYDNVVKQYQGLRDTAADKKRALTRTHDQLKDAYYILRDEENRNLNP